MFVRAVVFDLDGTLLDTLADISDAANRVLVDLGFPTHPHDAYRRFIGDGVPMLFRRALPDGSATDSLAAQCADAFRSAYEQTWNVHTRLYDGIETLLDRLLEREVMLAVLSNKPDVFTQKCVNHYCARWPFKVTYGVREGIPRKPDPTALLQIVQALEVSTDQCVYVGDSHVDMRTGGAAGITAIGAAWGFRSAEELWSEGAAAVIETPVELLEVLDGRRTLRTTPSV
jgi:phosphoglycolate phosphatase